MINKIVRFLFIGGFTFVSGSLLLYVLVELFYVNVFVAYVIQAVYSIEINFCFNYKLNWKNRQFKSSWIKFHQAKIATVAIDQTLFFVLQLLSVHYMIANVITTGLLTVINFCLNEFFVFRSSHKYNEYNHSVYTKNLQRELHIKNVLGYRYPTVGIVVPCRNSQEHIENLLLSLYTAVSHYAGKSRIYLVGSIDDKTWSGINTLNDELVTIIEIPENKLHRDSNRKRLVGAEHAIQDSCELIFYTDTKITIPENTLSNFVRALIDNNVDVVAGTFKRNPTQNQWWARVLDDGLITDVPRFGNGTVFKDGSKTSMPITACLMLTQNVLSDIKNNWPLENELFLSHEDTRIAYEILKSGARIWVSDNLFVYHEHRTQTRQLIKKWLRAGLSMGNMFNYYPDSQFVRLRFKQTMQLTFVLFCAGFLTICSVLTSYPFESYVLLSLCLLGYLIVGLYNVYRAKDTRALLYPIGTTVLLVVFLGSSLFSYVFEYRDTGRLLQTK